ncbi:MAG: alkaline phytoceramidase [Gallionella sp.]
MRPDRKAVALWLLAALLAGLTWALLPPIPQPLQYHDFADRSTCLGIAGCFDVATNALFALAGLAGLRFLSSESGRRAFVDAREALPYRLFFFAAVLVALGSGYYHLAPDNDRLVWDRAAIALAQMSLFAAMLCERVSITAGLRLLPLLFAAGLGSVAWWSWSEAQGVGDLRAYGLMQLYPMLLIPLLLRLYPPRYSGDRDILTVIGLYLLALLCDFTDRRIAELTGLFSGHTAKHVVAALAVYWVVIRLRRRRIL